PVTGFHVASVHSIVESCAMIGAPGATEILSTFVPHYRHIYIRIHALTRPFHSVIAVPGGGKEIRRISLHVFRRRQVLRFLTLVASRSPRFNRQTPPAFGERCREQTRKRHVPSPFSGSSCCCSRFWATWRSASS